MRTLLSLVTALCFAYLAAGCGSVSKSSPRPTPTPNVSPSPSPSPTVSPSPTPGPTASPTPSPTPDAFLATMFESIGRTPAADGQVTVDTISNNGAGDLKLVGVGTGANTNFILEFCPYPRAFTGCTNLAAFATDAGGNASVNFQFAQKGSFAGQFAFLDMTGFDFAASSTGSSGVNFHAALLPARTISGGIGQTTGTAPGSGLVTVNGTTAHVVLTGTTPNNTFSTAVCDLFPQTPCTPLANITTDANGNASVDVGTVQPPGPSIFRLSDAAGVEFVSGFRVQ